MKSRTLVLVSGLAVIWLFTAAFANGNGDVSIRVDGELPSPGYPQLLVGSDNLVQIWIKNDAPLYGLSLALSFDLGGVPFYFETPYGILPDAEPVLQLYGLPSQWFNPDSLQVRTDLLPNTILIQGRTSTQPLPVHANSTLCYSLMLHISCGGPLSGLLTVDNVVLAPGGIWMFDDGTPYAPTFQGQSNTSMTVPDAPAVTFLAMIPPCGYPFFTATPNPQETISHCSEFKFTFGAQDTKCRKGPLEFSSSVGEMNPTTGEFTLLPGPSCAATVVNAVVTNIGCMTDEFAFTVNWIDTPLAITNRPMMTGYVDPNEVYEYSFASSDPDACDAVTFGALPVQSSPAGEYTVDLTGKFSFTPTSEDSGHTYSFDLIANGGCGQSDVCRFAVKVGAAICGDANCDDAVNISDAVYLISYIFAGGLPPNPLLSGDADCNAAVNISDAVYLISYIFSGGLPPGVGCQ